MSMSLFEAAKAVDKEWFSNGSSIHLPRVQKLMEYQRATLEAERAEWKKRREESHTIAAPFTVEPDGSDWCVRANNRAVVSDGWSGRVNALTIAAALNLYFGYSADGATDYVDRTDALGRPCDPRASEPLAPN